MNKKFHYAFVICFACTITLFVCTGLACNDFSVYMPYILKNYGISNTQSSSILLTRSIFVFLAVSAAGRYYKRINMRTGMFIAALISALSYVVYSIASDFPMIILGAALTGIGFGIGATLPVSMLLNRWFKSGRNAAMSISAMGTTIAVIGIPSLITNLIENIGLKQTFLIQALLMAVLAFICFLLIRNDPEDMSLSIYEKNTAKHHEPSNSGIIDHSSDTYDTKFGRIHGEIRPHDWFILLPTLFLVGVIANPAYNHLSVFFNGEGFSPSAIAIALSFSGIAGSAGKFLFGWLSDHVSVFFCNFLYGIMMTAGLIVLCISRSDMGLYIGITLFVAGVGITVIGPSAWAGDLGSREQFDSTIQRFQQMYSFGSIVFALFPGVVADHSHGSYLPAYLIFTAFCVIITAAIQYMYIANMRRSKSKAE